VTLKGDGIEVGISDDNAKYARLRFIVRDRGKLLLASTSDRRFPEGGGF